tara:strand:+ start:276 stop:449 length:174 start_codon:yes stop_codon:yes gene_type:complete
LVGEVQMKYTVRIILEETHEADDPKEAVLKMQENFIHGDIENAVKNGSFEVEPDLGV